MKEIYSVDSEVLGYFKQKCDENYVSVDEIVPITNSDIDLMFVRDKNKIEDETSLKSLVERGGTLDLVDNVEIVSSGNGRGDRIIFTKDANLNLHRSRLVVPVSMHTGDNMYNWSALYVEEGANVIVEGDEVKGGGIYVAEGETSPDVDGPYCLTNFGGNLTIKSGVFRAHGSCVYGYAGITIIEGGFFEADSIHMSGHKDHPWTLNILNSAYKDGTAQIIVRGGTFVNFDPSNPDTDDASTYVETGYKVEQEKRKNGDVWYKVVKE